MSNRTCWLALALVACAREPGPAVPDPASLERGESEVLVEQVAHGLFFDVDGNEVAPDEAAIRATQDGLIAELESGDGARWEKTRALIFDLVQDEVVAHGLYLDVLLSDLDAVHEGRVAAVANGLRWHYLLEIRKEKAPVVGERWTRGVPEDVTARLEGAGVPVALVVGSGGEEYSKACEAAGVPVPDVMFGPGWKDRGEVVGEFLETGQTMLLTWETAEPDGICLALPRYSSASDGTANVFGVICLGRQSSAACFWDNPTGNQFQRDVQIPFSQFVGGVDLVANGQGECTDCHAGENPFVVHPEKKAFADILAETSLMPLSWHEPLVDAIWKQNPGPTTVLDAVSSDGRCDSCHRAGFAGRFPAINQSFGGYCRTILDNAVRELPPGGKGTMPPFGADQSEFSAHIDALQDLCDLPDPSGTVVDTDVADDPSLISPPKVIDPIYACSEVVGITASVLHAKVTVYVNGSAVSTREAFSPSMETFSVPALVVGDVIEADQIVDGVASVRSPAVIVRDHKLDYPAGLPAPQIAPPIVHECASTIAVAHVPGAKFTVYTNGADPRVNWGSPGGYTVGYPSGAPFAVGDTFTAELELCADGSPLSDKVEAKASPSSLPAPSFSPPQLYVGQELIGLSSLVHGADTTVFESGTPGDLGRTGSWPVTWYPDFYLPAGLGRPLALGDVLFAQQTLCFPSPPNGTGETGDCTQLPPPLIATPWEGQTWVSVTDSVPGARIRVYDATNVELGDGSGTVVLLSRALTGSDVLTVTQSLQGKCNNGQGYQVGVQGKRD